MSILSQTQHIPLANRFLLLNPKRLSIRESIQKHIEPEGLNEQMSSTCIPYFRDDYQLQEKSGRTDFRGPLRRIVTDESQANKNKSNSIFTTQYNYTKFQPKRVYTINKLGSQLLSFNNRFYRNTSKLLNKKSLNHLFIVRNTLLAGNKVSKVPRISSFAVDSTDSRHVDLTEWISMTSNFDHYRVKLMSFFGNSATPNIDYLLELIRRYLIKPLSVDFVKVKSEERMLDLCNRNTYYDSNDRENGSNRTYNSIDAKAAVSFLAMLGFFKGSNATDLEEENAKLTDEQRIKKMKPVEILIARGVLAMCDQEYREADIIFHKALNIAQTEENEEQETLVLNLLASNFFESGDFEAAERLFIDLMKRMIAKNVDQTDPAILELSLKLSSIYSTDRKTHDKALEGFKFVISSLLDRLKDLVHDIEEINVAELGEDLKNELALLGWSYDWFGKYLIAVNDFKGAAEMLQKALQISSKVLGPLHDQTLILLNDIGTTLAMNNAPEKGETFIQKAVGGAIESQSKELASFYVNLGLVKLKLRKYSEAKRYCEYSIELALKNGEQPNSQEVIALSKKCLDEVKRLLEVDTNDQ